jgi:hypothetical protein
MQRGIEAYFSRGDNKNEIPDGIKCHICLSRRVTSFFQWGWDDFPCGFPMGSSNFSRRARGARQFFQQGVKDFSARG